VSERTWVWLALVGESPEDATAAAPAHEEGEAAGWLALWAQQRKPVRHAVRADARLIDVDGAAAAVSLVLPPDGVRMPVDDLAVQQARRRVLADRPADAISLLLRGASHFEGSIAVYRDGRAGCDPFARVFPARVLEIDAGALGTAPAPAGPVIERYGSANPWPWDRYG
jgi:hypothetical protein